MGWSWNNSEPTNQNTTTPAVPSTLEGQDVPKRKVVGVGTLNRLQLLLLLKR